MSFYLFIDGAYLREVFSDFGSEWFGEPNPPVNYEMLSWQADKTFYYDCFPPKQLNETQADYESRTEPHEVRFRNLRALNRWHVVEGVMKRRRKAGNTQKEVDILIAVDMLTHTHRKNMAQLHFIAGDQDFRPLVEAVVREGMIVHLFYEAKSASQELIDASDSAYEMDPYFLHARLTAAFQHTHTLPNRWIVSQRNNMLGTLVAQSSTAYGDPVGLWSNNDSYTAEITTQTFNGTEYTYYRHPDAELVKKMCAIKHGKSEWTVA